MMSSAQYDNRFVVGILPIIRRAPAQPASVHIEVGPNICFSESSFDSGKNNLIMKMKVHFQKISVMMEVNTCHEIIGLRRMEAVEI
jgi:hypothetical protein